jgi:hypothetical protein
VSKRYCLPPGRTEAEVHDAVERIALLLSRQFVFGYYDIDDIKQQCRLYAYEALASGQYDSTRPIENFLSRSVRNRLLNLRRDKLRRADAPCKRCHRGQPCGPDGQVCAPYASWSETQRRKSAVCSPASMHAVPADVDEAGIRTQSPTTHQVEGDELRRLIDERLPVDLREPYLRMLAQDRVEHHVRRRVQDAVLEIMREVGYGEDVGRPE